MNETWRIETSGVPNNFAVAYTSGGVLMQTASWRYDDDDMKGHSGVPLHRDPNSNSHPNPKTKPQIPHSPTPTPTPVPQTPDSLVEV